MISMNFPSRGERESATTTRYTGFFFDPTRVSLIRTAISPPLSQGSRGSPRAPLLLRVYPIAELKLPPGEARLRRPFHATHDPPHRPRAPLARSGGSVGNFPLLICFIIFCICLRAVISWFTCCAVVPLPL